MDSSILLSKSFKTHLTYYDNKSISDHKQKNLAGKSKTISVTINLDFK